MLQIIILLKTVKKSTEEDISSTHHRTCNLLIIVHVTKGVIIFSIMHPRNFYFLIIVSKMLMKFV